MSERHTPTRSCEPLCLYFDVGKIKKNSGYSHNNDLHESSFVLLPEDDVTVGLVAIWNRVFLLLEIVLGYLIIAGQNLFACCLSSN